MLEQVAIKFLRLRIINVTICSGYRSYCANKKSVNTVLRFNFDTIKPQGEYSGNSNLRFVFAEKLCENSNKINTGGGNRPIFGKGKSKCGYQSVHSFLIIFAKFEKIA